MSLYVGGSLVLLFALVLCILILLLQRLLKQAGGSHHGCVKQSLDSESTSKVLACCLESYMWGSKKRRMVNCGPAFKIKIKIK